MNSSRDIGQVALTGLMIFPNTEFKVALCICSLVGGPGRRFVIGAIPPAPVLTVAPTVGLAITLGPLYNIENRFGRILRALRSASVEMYLDNKRG